jgi:hypothetical protein
VGRLEQIKSYLSWGPSVSPKLERLFAIDDNRAGLLPDVDRELMRVRSAPVTREEHTARVVAWIRETREQFLGEAQSPFDLRLYAGAFLAPLAAAEPQPPHVRPEDVWPLVRMLLGPQLKASAGQAVAQLPVSAPGLPSQGRAARIAELEAQRAALVAEHEQLVTEIRSESGGAISVEHLTETQARLATEARQRELAARVDEERRTREAAIDQRHGPRVARSTYLDQH